MRLIDADELKDFYQPFAKRHLSVPVDVVLLNVDDMPTIEVEPVVQRGKWVYDKNESKRSVEKLYMCSACRSYHAWGIAEVELFNFCPNCGAMMDEGAEDE